MRRGALLALALALALAWFAGLGHRKLVKADEARYGEIAREMATSGDWLTPRLNGFKYFEKPPLQYWATAAAYRAFGVSERSARLWTALASFLGVLLTGFAAARFYGPAAGICAAAVLAGSALYVALGHFLTLDAGLTFFLSVAVFSFTLGQAQDNARRRWMLLAWAAMALAVLSKGLIGIVLPAATLAVYALWQRDARLLRRLHAGPGALLFLAIVAPWFAAVSFANPEFFRFFFVHEHFERFLTTVHERYRPVWYFAPVLAAGILPWLLALPAALWSASRAPESAAFRPSRLLLAWCAVVFVFFSASSSKLPSYILPLFPPLAVLIGAYLVRAPRALLCAQAAFAVLAGAGLVWLGMRLPDFERARVSAAMLEAYRPWVMGAGVLLCALALAAFVLAAKRRAVASAVALSAAALGGIQLAMLGHETLSEAYSAYHIVERARPALKAGAPFFAVDAYDHTLPFYLGRTITMVSYRDELGAAIGWEPHKFLPDLPAFAAAWAREPEAFAVFAAADFERIRREHGLAAEVIARDARFVIARKP